MALRSIKLTDKYTQESGTVMMTGVQALVRLPVAQRLLDQRNGLNTAGFISGYRGSPLGTYDSLLVKEREYLASHQIKFQSGVNEELGATAVWGTQQLAYSPGAQVDGVFGIWYGKGPGVDRTGDVLKHANLAGTSPNGGVIAFAGDDHACKSSTAPNQSEFSFYDAEMPVLNPCGAEELLEYGILGWAMSRFSGCWVGVKTIADTMDSTATFNVDSHKPKIVLPEDFDFPSDGVHLRLPDSPIEQEARLRHIKLPAAQAFARVNNLNRVVLDCAKPRLGIITTGKAYLHTCQALSDLGIDQAVAERLGLRVLKIGMSWPLEPQGVREFSRGLEEVIVIEERRDLIEHQVKTVLYDMPDSQRPRILGKRDDRGQVLLRDTLDLDAAQIAQAIVSRLPESARTSRMTAHIKEISQLASLRDALQEKHARGPYFCAGCPHNRSTKIPEGSRAMAGIGCHYMVQTMDRDTQGFTQMGGEGVPWIGQAPFTSEEHIFANLGDGTYSHSGSLAIRQSIASGVNITYKILYNDAVAMTGGQRAEAEMSIVNLLQQLTGEGVASIAIVSENPEAYDNQPKVREMAAVHKRDSMNAIMDKMRRVKGCSIIIYDQTCATEKRRRRKRGLLVDPNQRVVINPLVCEGCGDCSVQSNCVAIEPLETEFGRKRTIEQSSCNKDKTCVEGFCPSFVSVVNGKLRTSTQEDPQRLLEGLPEPVTALPENDTYNIFLAGVGGMGVTALAAIVGMAAHLEGKSAMLLDMLGMSQKGGGVYSHLRIAEQATEIHGPRIGLGQADLVLAADIVVAAGKQTLPHCSSERTYSVVNRNMQPTAEFIKDNAVNYDVGGMQSMIEAQSAELKALDATLIVKSVLGDAIYTNMFLLGVAWQLGRVPLSREALEQAISLNGVAIDKNLMAFNWGRLAAARPDLIEGYLPKPALPATSLDDVVEIRTQELTAYQNADYAKRYTSLVDRVRSAEQKVAPESQQLALAVAHYYYQLLSYKDEYEVARLYTDGRFANQLRQDFEGDFKLEFHLAPPLLSRKDKFSGLPRKVAYGSWMLSGFKGLTKLKFLRGTVLDVFGYTEERKMERRLIEDYERMIERILSRLDQHNYALAVRISESPSIARGFGHIKQRNVERYNKHVNTLLSRFDENQVSPVKFVEPVASA